MTSVSGAEGLLPVFLAGLVGLALPLASASEDAVIELTSPVLGEENLLPADYTHIGKDISPPLVWSGLPAGTAELALIFDGPHETQSTALVHWLVYGIPAGAKGLPERVPRSGLLSDPEPLQGVLQGNTAWGNPGYRGPSVTREPATYLFRIYALDADLALRPGLDGAGLLEAINGHVLATGELRVSARR